MTEEFDNNFDPATVSTQSETPPLDVIILEAIQDALVDVHTMLPAKIVKIRSASQVDIEILLKRKFKSGEIVTLPIIQNVPVQMPRGAGYGIRLPFAVDDTGMAIFSERSLDVWTVSGGTVDPQNPRTHDLSDGVFVPGLYPFDDVIDTGPGDEGNDDLVLYNGSTTIAIANDLDSIDLKTDFGDRLTISAADGIQASTPAGGGTSISMKNGTLTAIGSSGQLNLSKGKVALGGAQELLDLFDQLLTSIQALTVGTGVGPSSVPINVSEFLGIQTKLATIKGSLA